MDWWQILLICLGGLIVLALLSIAFYKPFFKRFYDVFLSLCALIILSPLLLMLLIAGSVVLKGNPFFVQSRPGKKDRQGNERIFKLIKFRTMSDARDEDGKLLSDEKRLNGYGKFLRSTSLDELGELINILKGDMSIVGPRPQLVKDMVFMDDKARTRHAVRPGLTGLAQVNGRNNISWESKFEYDLQYIQRITFVGDIKILFMTAFKVFKRNDVAREGTVSDVDYGDWLLGNGKISQEEYDLKQSEAERLLR